MGERLGRAGWIRIEKYGYGGFSRRISLRGDFRQIVEKNKVASRTRLD